MLSDSLAHPLSAKERPLRRFSLGVSRGAALGLARLPMAHGGMRRFVDSLDLSANAGGKKMCAKKS